MKLTSGSNLVKGSRPNPGSGSAAPVCHVDLDFLKAVQLDRLLPANWQQLNKPFLLHSMPRDIARLVGRPIGKFRQTLFIVLGSLRVLLVWALR